MSTQIGGNTLTSTTSDLTSIPESLYTNTKLEDNSFSLTSLPDTLKETSQLGGTNLSNISEQSSSYSSYDSDYISSDSQNNNIDFDNTKLSDILSLA